MLVRYSSCILQVCLGFAYFYWINLLISNKKLFFVSWLLVNKVMLCLFWWKYSKHYVFVVWKNKTCWMLLYTTNGPKKENDYCKQMRQRRKFMWVWKPILCQICWRYIAPFENTMTHWKFFTSKWAIHKKWNPLFL